MRNIVLVLLGLAMVLLPVSGQVALSHSETLKVKDCVRKNVFKGRKYKFQHLPTFEETQKKLPKPIFDEQPDYVKMYWDTWEMVFSQFRQPAKNSPFISNYIDEAYNEALFLWDTSFMTMFCNYGYPYVPGIQSLDNFYYSQMEDGEIVREIDENTGLPRVKWAKPGTPASLNHPILAWAEIESFKITADTSRLQQVYFPLVAHYYAYNKIRDPKSLLFYGSWASMDNSPRLDNMLCGLDTSAELVLFARNLSEIAGIIGLREDSSYFACEAKKMSENINNKLWDGFTNFYYDLNKKGEIHNVKTIAAYWTLLAKIPSKYQASKLVDALKDKSQFNRVHRVPTVPADEPAFEPQGGYWRGGVWTPTNIMVIEGLENYGYIQLAREIALNHFENVYKVYKKTGTVWEFYQPDFIEVGYQKGHRTRPDFTGWTGCVPIKIFIEYVLGIKVNAPDKLINWDIRSDKRIGIEQLQFGDNIISMIADERSQGKRLIKVVAKEAFLLTVTDNENEFVRHMKKGINMFYI